MPATIESGHRARSDEGKALLTSSGQEQAEKPQSSATERTDSASRTASKNQKGEDAARQKPAKKRIYWLIPVAAVSLFLLGLFAAIGHYSLLSQLENTPVSNQKWTQRYSLALAYVFKSAMASSISIAITQHVWIALRRATRGTPVQTVDAMFTSGTSILSFVSLSLWTKAIGTGLMAACIWLMPLTALVAPSSLTVGDSVALIPVSNCVVPTLDWALYANDSIPVNQATSLAFSNYEDIFFRPSVASERLTAAVADTGRQNSWQSPCGANCTYDTSFVAPSWQCEQRNAYDFARSNTSAWPSNLNQTYTKALIDDLQYNVIYQAKLDALHNLFWIGYAPGFAEYILNPQRWDSYLGQTFGQIFDIRQYSCQVANTSFDLRVEYIDHVQNTTILQARPFQTLGISQPAWNGKRFNGHLPAIIQDIVGMFLPVVKTLSGTIASSPGQTFAYATEMGLISTLTSPPPSNITPEFIPRVPYLPQLELGPLLQELSYNLSISLMSYPDLLVTNTTNVTCTKHITSTVWKFDRTPLVAAYSMGLFVTLVCLAVGGWALMSNGVAHDSSFSSVVRTTRNRELDVLADEDDVGALPLPRQARKRRLRFLEKGVFDDGNGRAMMSKRDGFILVE